MKRDLYQDVTDRIVAQLEAGTLPWVKNWSTAGSTLPMNAISERPYSGINVLLFWMSQDKGYARPRYLTFKQAQEAGGSVRKGEHGTKVIFFKPLKIKDKATGEDKEIPMARDYTVFNVDQCERLPEKLIHGKDFVHRNQDEREHDADAFVASTGADFREGAGNPCYIPSLDFITMPAFGSFTSKPAFYATAFHELVHWTGAKARLDRDLKPRFDKHAYALEELVAELGAAFLCAEFGFDNISQAASYLEHWISALKESPRAIFAAASAAAKAAQYLRDLALAEPVQEAA